MMNHKLIASTELTIIIVSLFAFSYLMGQNLGLLEGKEEQLINLQEKQHQAQGHFWGSILTSIKKPMLPLASAQEPQGGCCQLNTLGETCSTTTKETCQPNSPFATGQTCEQTSFCRPGCCYNPNTGIFSKRTLKNDCTEGQNGWLWNSDPSCNLPEAQRGCCMLGTTTIYETRGACETDTQELARGLNKEVIWKEDIPEAECILLSEYQKEGACVLEGETCTYNTLEQCTKLKGEFYEGLLCTAKSLETNCEPTNQTTCVAGKDAVYYQDSCGNTANIYDTNKAKNQDYWERVITKEESCGSNNEDANADSKTCGNCNRFLGSICSTTTNEDQVLQGNHYCKDVSCEYQGEHYENGESFCVYDGQIGNSNDVPGSRHWKYYCNQGVIEVEPCADYRNEICVQSDIEASKTEKGTLKNAACTINGWRACQNYKNDTKACNAALHCRVEQVRVGDFQFDACVPKYPGGFDLTEIKNKQTSKAICGQASVTCTKIEEATFTGGCKVIFGEECTTEKYTQEMNDYCRSLGDCGGEVNIEGKYSKNYAISNAPPLSPTWINDKLRPLATPTKGQTAKVEDTTKLLRAKGILPPDPNSPEGPSIMEGVGIAGVVIGTYYAIGTTAIASLTTGATTGTMTILGTSTGIAAGPVTATIGAIANMFIGAVIGAVVGMFLADTLGLSPLGTYLMVAGGAIAGAVGIGAAIGLLAIGPAGWVVLAIGALLMLVGALFGAQDCETIDVKFTCKVWQPPAGGEDCSKCDNPDTPMINECSAYRCHSLGAACELVNKGTTQELCTTSEDDGQSPIPRYLEGPVSPGTTIIPKDDGGITIQGINNKCVNANEAVYFSMSTNEPTLCKADFQAKPYQDMMIDIDENIYTNNHLVAFSLPDPSHGQSQGVKIMSDYKLYITCQDKHGHQNPLPFTANVCVKEGPDKQSPRINMMEPPTGQLIGYNTTEKTINVITNELATCKWGTTDQSYDTMKNSMTCTDNIKRPTSKYGYVCTGILPTPQTENTYYIRCKDQPWLEQTGEGNNRNEMIPSTTYTNKKPTGRIQIQKILPTGTIESGTERTPIELEIHTKEGGQYHTCAYSFTGYDNMIELWDIGITKIAKQPLNLLTGSYTLYAECKDETGDSVRGEANFSIIGDYTEPQIARVWKKDTTLNFITTEMADCTYSTQDCTYSFTNGTKAESGFIHSFPAIRGNSYSIKCKDKYGNLPEGCTLHVRT